MEDRDVFRYPGTITKWDGWIRHGGGVWRSQLDPSVLVNDDVIQKIMDDDLIKWEYIPWNEGDSTLRPYELCGWVFDKEVESD